MWIQPMPRYFLRYFSRATEKPRIKKGLYIQLKRVFILPQFRGLTLNTSMRLPGNEIAHIDTRIFLVCFRLFLTMAHLLHKPQTNTL
jgi:hypothetical protein